MQIYTTSARMSGTNSTIFPLYARPCARAPDVYFFYLLSCLYSKLVPSVPSFHETSETSETIVPIKPYTRVRAWYTSLYFSIPSILRARFTRFSFHLATRATKATRLSVIPIRACAPGIYLFISLFCLYSKLVALVASLPLIHNKLSLSTVSKMIETRCDVL